VIEDSDFLDSIIITVKENGPIGFYNPNLSSKNEIIDLIKLVVEPAIGCGQY